MYGVRVLQANGIRRRDYEGHLVGFPTNGDWSKINPFVSPTLEGAQAKAAEMQKGFNSVLYTPVPLPCVIQ